MGEERDAEYFACKRKIAYASRANARLELKKMLKKGKKGSRLNVYQCSYCGWFHIGNNPKKRRKYGGPK